MLDRDKLRAAWVSCGETQTEAAKRLGISPRAMSSKMQRGVFGSDEIETLISAYHIEDPLSVFFANAVT